MMISTKGRYALRVMIDIAQNGGEAPVSLHDVAKRQEVSIKYLEAIISMLVKAGFVDGFRGKSGGYLLQRAPEEITVKEIIETTEGTTAPVAATNKKANNFFKNFFIIDFVSFLMSASRLHSLSLLYYTII